MVFGTWAIVTGVICFFGFSYLFYVSLSEKKIENVDSQSSQSDS